MKALLQEQERQMLGAIRPREPFGARDLALICFAVHTGLRSYELCSLDHLQVLTRAGAAREWLELVGKGAKSRIVPLNAAARQSVLEIVDFNRRHGFSVEAQAPLLVTRKHTRLPTRSLRDRIQRYRERADLDIKASPHTFRHTMASRLAEVAPLPVVQRILGHARLSSTQIYTHCTAQQMAEAMARLVEG